MSGEWAGRPPYICDHRLAATCDAKGGFEFIGKMNGGSAARTFVFQIELICMAKNKHNLVCVVGTLGISPTAACLWVPVKAQRPKEERGNRSSP